MQMTKHIYEPDGVDCPECGQITYELFNVESESGQEVLMCGGCYGGVNKNDFKFKLQQSHWLLRKTWRKQGLDT